MMRNSFTQCARVGAATRGKAHIITQLVILHFLYAITNTYHHHTLSFMALITESKESNPLREDAWTTCTLTKKCQ